MLLLCCRTPQYRPLNADHLSGGVTQLNQTSHRQWSFTPLAALTSVKTQVTPNDVFKSNCKSYNVTDLYSVTVIHTFCFATASLFR